MNHSATVLVVDDEAAHRLMMRAHLEEAGFKVHEAGDGEKALAEVDGQDLDLVLLDVVMPRMDGFTALERIKALRPELPVIMMTAYGSIESAVEALRAGAEDYLTKPLDMEEVVIKVQRHLKAAGLARKVAQQAERLGERFDFSALVGESPPMRKLKEAMALVSPAEATVLISGESGTGKEIIAQMIHQNSPRSEGPLVKLNCAALPENLLESELFGHQKGAFTGATSRREGRFAAAEGGSIFLDEVGEMSGALQAKLLRVLQEGEYNPVGSDKVRRADVRVLAASNRDLSGEVAEGRFRQDLFYRLNVVNLLAPPLRERGEDILLLADMFLGRFNQKNKRRIQGFSAAARAALMNYSWPGNVRELENAVERAVILCQGARIDAGDLPAALQGEGPSLAEGALRPGMTIRQAERLLIEKTLESTEGNRSQAARLLGITRKTLQNKIKEFGLPPAG